MRDRSARFTVLSDIGYCRTATLFTLENERILLAKSTEHNPCGKICSPSGVILDKNRALVLLFSIIIYYMIRTYHLVVISPTVVRRETGKE
jgi:hypothetical protein